MSKLFKFQAQEPQKCLGCGDEKYTLCLMAYSQNEANNLWQKYLNNQLEEDDQAPLCSECMTDHLFNEEYVVAKEFDEYDYPDMYFPNYFSKEDIERMINRKLTEDEWGLLMSRLDESNIMSDISETLDIYLSELMRKKYK